MIGSAVEIFSPSVATKAKPIQTFVNSTKPIVKKAIPFLSPKIQLATWILPICEQIKVKLSLIFPLKYRIVFLFCTSDPCDLRCTREFKLLCGSNAKTYNNECLKKEDECRTASPISVVKKGPCSDSSVVFESPEPEGKSFIKRESLFAIPDSADSLKALDIQRTQWPNNNSPFQIHVPENAHENSSPSAAATTRPTIMPAF